MQHQLFAGKGYTDEQITQMLEDNCDTIVRDKFLKKFSQGEANQRRKRNAEIDMELGVIKEDEAEMKLQIKNRREPLLKEKAKILEEIKMNGRYVEGRLFKFVDRDTKMVGFYDEDAYLVSSRKMTNEDKQTTLRLAVGAEHENEDEE